MRKIDLIIVHCSATPEGKDFTTTDIDRWHRQRGFASIGYHFVIYRDGSVHHGRPLAQVGAHCQGHNAHSIGICYIGGLTADGKHPKDSRTEEQKSALVALLRKLRVQFPNAKIRGHREMTCKRAQYEAGFNIAECSRHCANCKFAAKACPSFAATAEYAII